jgi:hypothetical protein
MNSSIMSDNMAASDLFQHMVQVEPRERPTALQVLNCCQGFLQPPLESIRQIPGLTDEKSDLREQPSLARSHPVASGTLSWATPGRSASGLNPITSFMFLVRMAARSDSRFVHACVVNRQNSLIAVQSYDVHEKMLKTIIYDKSCGPIWESDSLWVANVGIWRLPHPTFSEDGQYLAICESLDQVTLVDIQRSSILDSAPSTKPKPEIVVAMAIGTEGRRLAVAVYAHAVSKTTVTKIKYTQGELVVYIRTKYDIVSMAYTSGERFLVLFGDRWMEYWETATDRHQYIDSDIPFLREPGSNLYPLNCPSGPRIFFNVANSLRGGSGSRKCQLWAYSEIASKGWELVNEFAGVIIQAAWEDQIVLLRPDGNLVLKESDGTAMEVVVGHIEGNLPPLDRVEGVVLRETSVILVLHNGDFLSFDKV